MKRNLRLKPNKFLSSINFILSLIAIVLGIFYLVPTYKVFGIIWIVMASILCIYYGLNLFTKKGISLYEISEDDKKRSK